MENEFWDKIPNYEGLYEQSDRGRTKSLERWVLRKDGTMQLLRERILRPRKNNSGHLAVTLYREAKGTKMWVHRLVLLAFVGEPPAGYECCHANGDPADNRLANLRWDSRRANHHDKIAHGTTNRGSRCGTAKLKEVDIPAIRQRLAAGEFHRVIAADFGVRRTTISGIATGKRWGHI